MACVEANLFITTQSMPATVGVLFFSFTALFSLFSLLVFVMRLKPWCNCDVCRSFLTAGWASEFGNLCDWYTHLLRKSPTGTIHVHVLGNTITANPDNVEYMLKTRFDNFPKGKPFSTILGDLLGRGIFNVDGEPWLFQRKMASLELGSSSVRSYALEIVTSEIKSQLIPILDSAAEDSARVLDLQEVLRRFSFDNICRFSFGLDPGCLQLPMPMAEFSAAFDLASKVSAERAMTASPLVWKAKRMLNLGSEKKLRDAVRMVDSLAAEMISLRRREIMSNATSTTLSSDRKDLLSRFMASVDDDKYLRDIVVSFLLAGRDTVSSALTSFFYLVSRHPEVGVAIREEAERVVGSTESDVASFKEMQEMHYLHAAIHESMRLYPPVQFDSKFCKEDDVLPDGTFVRKGTRVTYHPYAMGRMERIWGPDCLEFKPERWLKSGVFTPVCAYKYPVFQAGLRVCLGREMAIMEMKSVAFSVIRRYDIRVFGSDQEPRFAPGLTATMRGGLPVCVEKRS